MELADQVVVVTGTSRGIGAGIARCCLAEGAHVVGLSRNHVGLDDHPRYTDVQLDLADPEATQVAFAEVIQKVGRLDALVNNAGVQHRAPCWEQTDEQWDAMMAVNLTAPFVLSQAFAVHCVAHGTRGTIVNICSVESEVAWKSPPQSGYAASKGALLGLTRSFALDLAEHGIRVVAVGPGAIDTGMATPERATIEANIPLDHRFGKPEEVGETVVFLLSPRASYMTGEIVYVDGGYMLR